MLIFLFGFILGGIFGVVITSIAAANGSRTRIGEAYHKGIEDGKVISTMIRK